MACVRTALLFATSIISLAGCSHEPVGGQVGETAVGGCGVERWAVKTGTDADANSVNFTPTDTTISALSGLSAPSTHPANNRVTPTETTVFRLSNITLVEYKLETDSDYHLVLSDGTNTMIGEIPSPSCVGSGSVFASGISKARAAFDAKHTATSSFQTANETVTVTGAGFFDLPHGQTGVAPNAIEIHAILDICWGTNCAAGSCTPQCTGKQCGPNGCGGSCGTCATGQTCSASGQCSGGGNSCAHPICSTGTKLTSGCDPCVTNICSSDSFCCSSSWDSTCVGEVASICNISCSCTPQCSGKQCGSDGCGGTCGTCATGQTCSASGQCTGSCTPQCSGKQCGSDGCGGSCGTCATGQICSPTGQCGGGCAHPICSTGTKLASGCDPCVTNICGSDSFCCSTSWDSTCVGEVASICNIDCSCTPQCSGKQCGSDGCGGSCGTCASGQTCNASGQCTGGCTPQCSGKQCGSDGCGGSCGTCGSGQTCSASGQCTGGGGAIQTVFVIVMENHNWDTIFNSSSAPFINNTLLPQASFATNYFNPPSLHPSEPNYLWMEAGTNFGVTTDGLPSANHQSSTQHLVTQLQKANISWKSYQEGITGTTCPLGNITSTKYAPKHNPMVFFDDVTNTNNTTSTNCINHVRPYSELAGDLSKNTVARYNFITPNLCDDMHDSTGCASSDSVANGDNWLSNEVPKILASAAFKNGGALFITWDESEGGDFPIGMIVLSPKAKGGGYSNSISYTHSSLLRTVQTIFGVTPLLGDANNATDLNDLFQSFP
jgi:hypothetical protein